MSSLRNRVQLIGHLGANPEMKNFDSGSKQVTMNIATSERYQVNGEWNEDTQWHRLVGWNQVAERAEQQLQKGSYVLIEGKLMHRSYQDAKGEQKYISEVQVQNFVSLDNKSENNKPDTNAEVGSTVNEPEEDDLSI